MADGEALSAEKFQNADVTASGAARASVPFDALETLWINTGTLCNIECAHCYIESSPKNDRLAYITRDEAAPFLDEAEARGAREIGFTGGEPFILNDIYEMLAYASARIKTTVLTNAMILRRARLDKLTAIANDNLHVQVSLDGGKPEHHDAYRGKGSWDKTVEGIKLLQERGFKVKLSTTETPANSAHLHEVCEFHKSLGIPEEDHFIRPLAKRGFSNEGLELSMSNLQPEVTVNLDGVFWHPLSTDADMLVNRNIFPLANSVEKIQQQLDVIAKGGVPLMTFT